MHRTAFTIAALVTALYLPTGLMGEASAAIIYDEGIMGDANGPLGSVGLGLLGVGDPYRAGSLTPC